MGAPDDLAELIDERRALLDLTAGRHQRRYARTRSLQRRARELTTALLRAETTRPEIEPAKPETMEDPDDEHIGDAWYRRRRG